MSSKVFQEESPTAILLFGEERNRCQHKERRFRELPVRRFKRLLLESLTTKSEQLLRGR